MPPTAESQLADAIGAFTHDLWVPRCTAFPESEPGTILADHTGPRTLAAGAPGEGRREAATEHGVGLHPVEVELRGRRERQAHRPRRNYATLSRVSEPISFKNGLAVALASAVTACGAPPPLDLEAGAPADWPAYGGAAGGGHYSAADEITRENVSRLEVAWVHRSGDFREGSNPLEKDGTLDNLADLAPPSALQVTPIVVENTLYYCTPFNRVFALDPESGEERWVFDPDVDVDQEGLLVCRGVSSWIDAEAARGAPCRHRIVMGTLDARIIALDGATGQRCADFGSNGEIDLTVGLSEHAAEEYSVTSPPAILGDTLITGAMVIDSARDDVPAGVVRAFDLRTGAFRWGWNPVEPGEHEVDADGRYVAGTTNVWSIISVDAERNLVFVPTGNSSPDYYGGDRHGLDHFSSSVVALDGTTGEVRWHYRTVHHDVWDFDVPSQPTLVDLPIDGRIVPAVVQVTKMGLTFVLDRDTGKPIFPVEERPVPQDGAVPGEYLSPTQPFPTRPPPLHPLGITPDDAWGFTFWDRGACRRRLEELRTGPIYTPIGLQGTVFYPSQQGGNNWGAPAVDPVRHVMIANTTRMPFALTLVPRDRCDEPSRSPRMSQTGSPYCLDLEYLVSPLGAPCTAPPWGTLSAVDLAEGTLLWEVPLGTLEGMAPWPVSRIRGTPTFGGPAVTASGLIFIAATTDPYLRAFDVETGEELWRGELPTTGNAVPMTYRVRAEGRQYVVIAAGGHFSGQTPAGDHLVAFALPESHDRP